MCGYRAALFFARRFTIIQSKSVSMTCYQILRSAPWPLSLTLLLLIGCGSLKEVPNRVVDHRYQVTLFSPEDVTHDLSTGLTITITPVDASGLNAMTYQFARQDGGYETEYISVFQAVRNSLDDLPKDQRRRMARLVDATEAVQNLIESGSAPDAELLQLGLNRMWDRASGGNGSDVERITNPFPSLANPYRIEGQYQSVFKMRVHNWSSSVQTIRLSDIQVATGVELLYPFAMTYYEDVFQTASAPMANAYRINMPSDLMVPGGATVEKYFAVPALNVHQDAVSVHLLADADSKPFEFRVQTDGQRQRYELQGYRMAPSRAVGATAHHGIFYSLRLGDGRLTALTEDEYFLTEEESTGTVDVCGIIVAARSNRHQIACREQVNLVDLQRRIITLTFEPIAR